MGQENETGSKLICVKTWLKKGSEVFCELRSTAVAVIRFA